MLHAQGRLHDLHDGAADVHAESSLLRPADRHLHDVPVSDALCPPSGAMLHDAVRAALRLPPGSGSGLHPAGPDVRRPDLRCSDLRCSDLRRTG